ncbi:MAG: TolB family protein [Myxococcaceae bacterium]
MRLLLTAITVVAVMGCDFIDVTGSGGGTGELSSFNQGFIFVRAEDRNLFATDKADSFQSVLQVTTNGANRQPSLSHDGRRVVFVHSTMSGTELQVATLGSEAEPSVVFASDSTRRNFRYPVFSPNDALIVFAYDEGAASYLGKITSAGANFVRLGNGVVSLTSASFYPDGVNVLAAAGGFGMGSNQLVKVNINSNTSSNVTSSLGAALSIANRAVLSPNGQLIAFDGRINSNATRLFVYDGTTAQLTNYPGDPDALDSFPTWIGNGEVGFTNNIGGADQVYSVSAAAMQTTGKLVRPSAIEPWYGP